MTLSKNKVTKLEIVKLTLSDLEEYLSFTTGLSVSDAKNQAAIIASEHSITPEDALRSMFWANGYPLIKKTAEGIEDLVLKNLGKNINEIGILKQNGEFYGFCHYDRVSESWQYFGYSRIETKKNLIKCLISSLIGKEQLMMRSKRFLASVKNCINAIGHDFYTLPKNMNLDEIEDIMAINIDHEALLHNGDGSGSNTIMRYALASCYNNYSTSKSVMRRALRAKFKHDEITNVDLADEYQRDSLTDYACQYQHFGAMCFNLDRSNKKIIKDLLENYCGW